MRTAAKVTAPRGRGKHAFRRRWFRSGAERVPAKMGGDVTDPRDVSAKHRKFLEGEREEPAGAWFLKASGARNLAGGAAGPPKEFNPQRDGNFVFAKLTVFSRRCVG